MNLNVLSDTTAIVIFLLSIVVYAGLRVMVRHASESRPTLVILVLVPVVGVILILVNQLLIGLLFFAVAGVIVYIAWSERREDRNRENADIVRELREGQK